MPFDCKNGRCQVPCWMGTVLLLAGIYHLGFAVWANLWPQQWFDWLELEHPNHPMLWRGVGVLMGALGIGFIVAARRPLRNWPVVLAGLAKFVLGTVWFAVAIGEREIPFTAAWMMAVDDAVWLVPFAMIFWAGLQAYAGIAPLRPEPLPLDEAGENYQLSTGETLAQASAGQTLVLVFLRHFGCTFTRQILRGLERLEREAANSGARLVLAHMLQSGEEAEYLRTRGGVARIADPRCELYRAFGLGKGGFWELFGPRVWWRGAVSIVRGCGVGHLAGDGFQMLGVFLFRDGRIVASQRAQSAADMPNLPRLFKGLPSPAGHDRVPA